MNFAAAHPTTYPSALESSGFVQRTSLENVSQPPAASKGTNRLSSNPIGSNPTIDRRTKTNNHSPAISKSTLPTSAHADASVINWLSTMPLEESLASLDDITEYSASLATGSKANTASSTSHTIDHHRTPEFGQAFFTQHRPNERRATSVSKDVTPTPSEDRSITIGSLQRHVTEPKAEHAWSMKVNQLNKVQAKREKDQARTSRGLLRRAPKTSEYKPPSRKPDFLVHAASDVASRPAHETHPRRVSIQPPVLTPSMKPMTNTTRRFLYASFSFSLLSM